MDRECASCGVTFTPKRSTAKFCTATCRQRAARERKAATQSVQADQAAGKVEHELVKAVRKELAEADALDTVSGQLALQIARRIVDPDGSGVSTLSKELRSLLAEAKADRSPEPDDQGKGKGKPEDDEDEVSRARRQREEARQAAGLA